MVTIYIYIYMYTYTHTYIYTYIYMYTPYFRPLVLIGSTMEVAFPNWGQSGKVPFSDQPKTYAFLAFPNLDIS